MFKTALCICVALCALESTFAQDSATAVDVSKVQASFVVQLTEYRPEQPLDPSLSAAAILEIVLAQRAGEKCEPVKTVRLSTLSGTESMVQFGRRANVTVGTATTKRGETVRNAQAIDVGTSVQVTVTPRNGQVALALTYESSRIEEGGNQDTTPDISKTQISTTQLLELGKPDLVGSYTTSTSSIIVVTVTQK